MRCSLIAHSAGSDCQHRRFDDDGPNPHRWSPPGAPRTSEALPGTVFPESMPQLQKREQRLRAVKLPAGAHSRSVVEKLAAESYSWLWTHCPAALIFCPQSYGFITTDGPSVPTALAHQML